jgi:hypothetical protein
MEKHTLECRVRQMMRHIESILPHYRQARARRIGPQAYLQCVPVLAALCIKGFAGFEGVEYILDEIARTNREAAVEAAKRLRDSSRADGGRILEIKTEKWLGKIGAG